MTTPTLASVIRQYVNRRIGGIRVSMPATVEKYDPATQTLSASPVFEEGDTRLPIVHNVPVAFPQGGGFSITYNLVPGDIVLLVFSDKSLEEWLTAGGVQQPRDRRVHSLSDAFAVPGINPLNGSIPAPATTGVVLGTKDGTTVAAITQTDVRLGSSVASDPVALSSLVSVELGKISAAIGSLGGTYAPAPVAASKVKAI